MGKKQSKAQEADPKRTVSSQVHKPSEMYPGQNSGGGGGYPPQAQPQAQYSQHSQQPGQAYPPAPGQGPPPAYSEKPMPPGQQYPQSQAGYPPAPYQHYGPPPPGQQYQYPYMQPMPQFAPQGHYQYQYPGAVPNIPPAVPGQQATYVVQDAFDAGARFDGVAQPNIPPPPPGVMPNAAQMAQQQGHNVVLGQKERKFFEGGSSGGYTFW